MGGISQMPLLPWAWKMALMRAWLSRGFFRPAGLVHMMPSGDASQMDYAGARGQHSPMLAVCASWCHRLATALDVGLPLSPA